jgi:hypothetical protein
MTTFCIEESDKTNLATCAERVTRGPLFGAALLLRAVLATEKGS